jgi:hypothetical protein
VRRELEEEKERILEKEDEEGREVIRADAGIVGTTIIGLLSRGKEHDR